MWRPSLCQVVQSEPLRFPEDPPVSDELRDLLSQMLCKVRGARDACLAGGPLGLRSTTLSLSVSELKGGLHIAWSPGPEDVC